MEPIDEFLLLTELDNTPCVARCDPNLLALSGHCVNRIPYIFDELSLIDEGGSKADHFPALSDVVAGCNKVVARHKTVLRLLVDCRPDDDLTRKVIGDAMLVQFGGAKYRCSVKRLEHSRIQEGIKGEILRSVCLMWVVRIRSILCRVRVTRGRRLWDQGGITVGCRSRRAHGGFYQKSRTGKIGGGEFDDGIVDR